MVLGTDEDAPVYDLGVRERLVTRTPANEAYIDELDLIGEVRAADLSNASGGSFRIRLENGESVLGDFTSDQESSVIEALRDHSEVRLRLAGQGRYEPSGSLQRILRVDYHEVIPAGPIPYDETPESILDIFDEIHRSMPEDALNELPADLSTNLKHYLYGWPKDTDR
jgi:hypothetical protein